MEDTLDHHAIVICRKEHEVTAMDRLSQALGEVISSWKCARSFRDPDANVHQLMDE